MSDKLVITEDAGKFNKPNSCNLLEKVYCVGEECDNVYVIMDEKDQIIGKGGYGQVYQACLKDKCDYVGKWVKIVYPNDKDDLMRELLIQYDLSLYNIAPSIKQLLLCDNGGMIIMSGLKITLRDYLSVLSDYQEAALFQRPAVILDDDGDIRLERIAVIEQLFDLIKQMNELHYVHNDLHLGNIMLDQNNRPYIIDFGLAKKVEEIDYSDIDHIRWKLKSLLFSYSNLDYLLVHFDLLIKTLKIE